MAGPQLIESGEINDSQISATLPIEPTSPIYVYYIDIKKDVVA